MALLEPVQINEIPQSIEDFIALRDEIAQTPQGGAAAMVVALLAYAEDEDLGRQCLTAAVDPSRLDEGPHGYEGWQLYNTDLRLIELQIAKQPHMIKSYVKGTTPEDGYQLPAPPYAFEFSYNRHSGDPESGRFKVFVACSGAATPRPVTVARDQQGMWKALEWSSLIVGVMAPPQEGDDA